MVANSECDLPWPHMQNVLGCSLVTFSKEYMWNDDVSLKTALQTHYTGGNSGWIPQHYQKYCNWVIDDLIAFKMVASKLGSRLAVKSVTAQRCITDDWLRLVAKFWQPLCVHKWDRSWSWKLYSVCSRVIPVSLSWAEFEGVASSSSDHNYFQLVAKCKKIQSNHSETDFSLACKEVAIL